jgi:thioredoxin 2
MDRCGSSINHLSQFLIGTFAARGIAMSDTLMIRCVNCGAMNRVPRDKLASGQSPVCGKCRAALSVHNKPVVVTDASFAAEVEQSPLPLLLVVWAPWCGPGRMRAPVLDPLAGDLAGKIKFAKINSDENRGTSARFRVDALPTLLVFNSGQPIDRMVGLLPKAEIANRLKPLAAR